MSWDLEQADKMVQFTKPNSGTSQSSQERQMCRRTTHTLTYFFTWTLTQIIECVANIKIWLKGTYLTLILKWKATEN